MVVVSPINMVMVKAANKLYSEFIFPRQLNQEPLIHIHLHLREAEHHARPPRDVVVASPECVNCGKQIINDIRRNN